MHAHHPRGDRDAVRRTHRRGPGSAGLGALTAGGLPKGIPRGARRGRYGRRALWRPGGGGARIGRAAGVAVPLPAWRREQDARHLRAAALLPGGGAADAHRLHRGARRRCDGGSGRLCGGDVSARHRLCPGAHDAAGRGRFFRRRQDGGRPAGGKEPRGRVPPAVARGVRFGCVRHAPCGDVCRRARGVHQIRRDLRRAAV